ncbi:spore germination protein [Domibacillus sp. PGB-M46]|uniref:spore germination protein n=1 Tax=Domibacillus sp. PGB-M46 TaxID=2910255 RepID=UPI001F59C56B|nr:spore germination protein [Domibacillus sp. PGB-M46]MCI2252968.1 spore germination protein [Domibacillus sp. PGB-M46]
MPFWRQDKGGVFKKSASENAAAITALTDSSDIKQRTFSYGKAQGILLYVETMVEAVKVENHVLQPLKENGSKKPEAALTVIEYEEAADHNDALRGLLRGKTLLFIEGNPACLLCRTERDTGRAIKEPMNEKVVRGAHDGFVEDISVNIFLVRKRVESKRLTVEYLEKGNRANTSLAIMYEKDIANPELVQRIKKRLESINAEIIYNAGQIEELIEDSTTSPFPQMLNTERPDRVAANLLEGRIAVFINGDPTCLIAPVSFFSFYQSPDDYTSRSLAGSFYRMIRLFSFFFAILLPAFYISVVSFHSEIVPRDLILQLKGSVEQVPYPALMEALFMELTIELIREAGIRLPTPIGQTIGIVGGLVIGDAVVSAGLVSNFTIIIVALTAISSYVVPSIEMNTAIRLLRFPFMVSASLFGFFGIVFALMILLIHLCKLKSLGMPYFSPLAPLRVKDLKDVFIRKTWWKLTKRPYDSKPQTLKRESKGRQWVEK